MGSEFFHRDRSLRDGLSSKCKDCVNSRYQSMSSEDRKAIGRRQSGTVTVQRRKQYYETYKAKHPGKDRCRAKLKTAVKSGRVDRPGDCSDCGVSCTPHGHHADYSKPLEVVWLCIDCHHLRHRSPAIVLCQ